MAEAALSYFGKATCADEKLPQCFAGAATTGPLHPMRKGLRCAAAHKEEGALSATSRCATAAGSTQALAKGAGAQA